MSRTLFIKSCCLFSIFFLASCASTNLTPLQKGNERLEEDEQRIWNRSKEEEALIDKSELIYHDSVLTGYVNNVTQKLVSHLPPSETLTFRVQVIKNPMLNAFTYPNGIIYIHTGILAKMENESQLATLLAHEMTHATHRHATQNFRSVKNNAGFFSIFSLATAPFGIYGAIANLLGEIGTLASISGYSQELETEADNTGFDLMISAGYDPREAPKLFEHIAHDLKDEDEKEPFFFGSHPKIESRIKNYNKFLKNRHLDTLTAAMNDTFMTKVLPLILLNTDMDIFSGRFGSAGRSIGHYFQYDSLNGLAHYYMGQVYERREKEKSTDNAEKEYTLAIIDQPGLAEPYKALGLIHMKQGKKEQARTELEKYIVLSPDAKDRNYIEQYILSLQH